LSLLACQLKLARERCQVIFSYNILQDSTEMIHVSWVRSIPNKHKVIFWRAGPWLTWLGIWNEKHLFKSNQFEQELGLVDITYVFFYVCI
jgi:hypothetical protein